MDRDIPLPPPLGQATRNDSLATPQMSLAYNGDNGLLRAQPLFYLPAMGPPLPQYYFAVHAQGPPPLPPDIQQQQQQVRRIRCTQACNYCHRRKARCVRNVFADGSVRCDSCVRDNVVCEWRKSRRRGPKRRDGDDSGLATESGASRPMSTLSIASLLNVAEDFSPDGDESTSASAEIAAVLDSSSHAVQPPSLGSSIAMASHYPLPACSRPAGVHPPALGNLMCEFYSARVDAALREAVIAYYTYFYGFCPILHPSTLLRKVVSGMLSPLLEDALRASTAMFVSKRMVGSHIDADALFSRLVTALAMRADAPTVDEVCAFQLASIGVSGLRGFVCFDTLKTAVSGLLVQLEWHELDRYDAHRPLGWAEWVERETKRRVVWINFKIDSHHAGVAGRQPIIDEGAVFLRAPCSDAEWDDLSLALLLQGGASHVSASVVLDALSQSFRVPTPYEGFMARIGMLQRNAKTSWVQQRALAPHTVLVPRLLGESPLFRKYDTELRTWHRGLVRAESLRDPLLAPHGSSFFGDVRQRRFLVRARYFCINIYALGMSAILHLANRPSFFTEAEPAHSLSEKEPIIALLLQKFGPTWCQGLVAQDVEPASWAICVQCAHDLADTLRNNSDIPLQFVDMVVPFFVFVNTTVLLRQIRRCRLAKDSCLVGADVKGRWQAELDLCLKDIYIQWSVIQELGSVWRVDAIAGMLRLMNIEEALASAKS
ncbi:hypothetical protein GGI20_002210 [Coemansia sp. BCRC 34301]|nr:hypothetical protein GGI20_002210 [Coemansia sp. BCRC 34301]